MVDAEGRVLRASDQENPDLFWALRGAGGAGFGVVTRLRYRLDVVPKTVMGGVLMWPLEHAAAVFRAYRDLYVGRDDDRLSLYLVLTTDPYPDGEKVVMVYGMYVGDPAEAESHLAPIRSAAKPLMDGFGPTSYYELQTMLAEEIPYGMQSKWRGGYFTDGGFDDDAFERIIDGFQRTPVGLHDGSLRPARRRRDRPRARGRDGLRAPGLAVLYLDHLGVGTRRRDRRQRGVD